MSARWLHNSHSRPRSAPAAAKAGDAPSSARPAASRTGAPKTSAVPPGMQHLDLAAMHAVYQETRLRATGSSPTLGRMSARIRQQLESATSLEQMAAVVRVELPAMSAPLIASTLNAVSFGVRGKKARDPAAAHPASAPSSSSAEEQASDVGDTGNADNLGAGQGGASATEQAAGRGARVRTGRPVEAGPEATALVRTLVRRLAVLASSSSGGVSVAHVTAAVLCAGRVLAPARWAPDAAQHKVSGNSSSNHSGPMDSEDYAAISKLLAAVQSSLFVATPVQLGQLAQGLAYIAPPRTPGAAPPYGPWLADFMRVAQSKFLLMDALQLSSVGWAAGKLGYQPGTLWLSGFETASLPLLKSMPSSALAHLVWAAAQWDAPPSEAWVSEASRVALASLHKLQPAAVACLMGGLTALRAPQPEKWSAAIAGRMVEQGGRARPAQITEVLACLLRMSSIVPPDEALLQGLTAAMSAHMQQAGAYELASTLWSLACMSFCPPSRWLSDWAACMQREVRGLNPAGVSMVLGAYARLRQRPPRQLAQNLLELQLAQARAGLVPAPCASRSLCALASLRVAPSGQLLRALVTALAAADSSAGDAGSGAYSDSSSTGSGPALSSSRPGEAAARAARAKQQAAERAAADLVDAFLALPYLLSLIDPTSVTVPAAPGTAAPAVSGVALPGSISAPGAPDPAAPAVTLGHATPAAASDKSPGAARAGTPGVGRSPGGNGEGEGSSSRSQIAAAAAALLPPAVLRPLLQALMARLPAMSGPQLFSVLRALADMRLYPGRAFMREHVAQAGRQMGTLQPGMKQRMSAYYTQLQDAVPASNTEEAVRSSTNSSSTSKSRGRMISGSNSSGSVSGNGRAVIPPPIGLPNSSQLNRGRASGSRGGH